MPKSDITVYGAHWCPDCRRSKQFLGEHQIPYNWVDIEQDTSGEKFVIEKNNGKRIIPTIVFADGTSIAEPTNAELAAKLKLKTKASRSHYDLIVLGGVIVFLRRPSQPELSVTSPPPTATPLPSPTPCPLRVYVSGAVTHPDVYELPTESIVKDAIEAAGGATNHADLDRINLALSLANGQHIYVPKQGEESPPVDPPTRSSDTASVEAGGKININTASQAEIETLPGIGPSKAQGIIENRPYSSLEDIKRVPGIAEGIFKNIKDSITVER